MKVVTVVVVSVDLILHNYYHVITYILPERVIYIYSKISVSIKLFENL